MSSFEELPTVPAAPTGHGETTIGLFHGMFEGNILTFNPGLTNRMERLESYADVRTIQTSLEDEGVALHTRAEGETGSRRSHSETPTAMRC